MTGLFRRLAVEASGALSASDRPRVHALLASRFEPVRPSDPAPPQVDLSPAARPHLADHSPPARSMPAQARPSPKSAPLLAPLSPAPASERVGRSPAPATLPQTASPPSPEDTRPAPRVAPFHDATAPILRRDSSPPPPGRSSTPLPTANPQPPRAASAEPAPSTTRLFEPPAPLVVSPTAFAPPANRSVQAAAARGSEARQRAELTPARWDAAPAVADVTARALEGRARRVTTEREVHVSIGRIEVTALREGPPRARKPRNGPEPMSLDDYLASRQRSES